MTEIEQSELFARLAAVESALSLVLQWCDAGQAAYLADQVERLAFDAGEDEPFEESDVGKKMKLLVLASSIRQFVTTGDPDIDWNA